MTMLIETAATDESSAITPQPAIDPADPFGDEARRRERDREQVDQIVGLAVAAYDPEDALRKHARLGAEVLGLAWRRKASNKHWGAGDFRDLCGEVAEAIRARSTIRRDRIKLSIDVRIHLWVEALRPTCRRVDRLTLHTVYNVFLRSLDFDASELAATIRPEWEDWLLDTVDVQLSSEPMSFDELKLSYRVQCERIDSGLDAGRGGPGCPTSPEIRARKKARNRVRVAIESAAACGALDGDALAWLIREAEAGLKSRGIAFRSPIARPAEPLGPLEIAGAMTAQEATMFARALAYRNNRAAIVAMRAALDQLEATPS